MESKTSIIEIGPFDDAFVQKMGWVQEYLQSKKGLSQAIPFPHTFVFTLDHETGEIQTISGPCGSLPSKEECKKMIDFLVLLLQESDERVNLYNLVQETKAYESMIEDLLKRKKKTKKNRRESSGSIEEEII